MIDAATVSKILDAADIVDVVSDFVTLKKSGSGYTGLCPFHDDRTPSFHVTPSRNYCKCFACGKGCTPVGFIMEHEQMTYPDALRYLAKKYGIPIQEREQSAEERAVNDDRESMFIVNEWARDWFRRQMLDTPDGRAIGLAYFRGRGFRDDIIEKFQVGFCPDSRTPLLATAALQAGYQEKYLVNVPNEEDITKSIGTGLCRKNESGQLRDWFRGRVIWPIFNKSGRVAGFGARVLDAATKGVNLKYLNSPESIVYSKSRELFGYQQGKNAIAKQKLCYVVEGYTDVMAMHQSGVENVVAASGTAFPTEQVKLIKRLTDNVVLIFDGDEAGIKASNKALAKMLPLGMNVKLLSLPDNDDPDSFARKHSPEEFQQYLEQHQVDFVSFKINLQLADAQQDVSKMVQLSHDVAATIALLPDEITRSLYIRKAATLLGLKEDEMLRTVASERKRIQEEWIREEQRQHNQQPSAASTVTSPADASLPEGYSTTSSSESSAVSQPVAAPVRPSASSRRLATERYLAELLIRYGEQVRFCVEDEETGQMVNLSVIEYIQQFLEAMELTLTDARYRFILTEGLQHLHEPGFRMQDFFLRHPDYAVNSLAAELCVDVEPLSKYHGEQTESEHLDEIIRRQITSLKLDISREELQQLKEQVTALPSDAPREERQRLLTEFMEKQREIRDLATMCGERVIG